MIIIICQKRSRKQHPSAILERPINLPRKQNLINELYDSLFHPFTYMFIAESFRS